MLSFGRVPCTKWQAHIRAIVFQVADENDKMSALSKHESAVSNYLSQSPLKLGESWCIGETPGVITVSNHLPVGWVQPNEIEIAKSGVPMHFLSVKTSFEVESYALDVQFIAYVFAGSTAGHRVQHTAGLVVLEKVPNQIA